MKIFLMFSLVIWNFVEFIIMLHQLPFNSAASSVSANKHQNILTGRMTQYFIYKCPTSEVHIQKHEEQEICDYQCIFICTYAVISYCKNSFISHLADFWLTLPIMTNDMQHARFLHFLNILARSFYWSFKWNFHATAHVSRSFLTLGFFSQNQLQCLKFFLFIIFRDFCRHKMDRNQLQCINNRIFPRALQPVGRNVWELELNTTCE